MTWVADISRPAPHTDDVKVAGAPVAGGPGYAGGATTAEYVTADEVPEHAGYDPPADYGAATDLEYGETTERLDGAADETVHRPEDEGEVTRDDLTPVRAFGTARRRKRRPARRSGRRIKVLGVAVAMTVAAGGAVGGWVLTAGPGQEENTKQTPVQAHGPPPLTDAQRKAAEAMRLRELERRASRAARDDDSRPMLFAKGTPPVTKKPETQKPETPDLGGPTPVGEAQRIAQAMLPDFGWSPSSQFGCLVNLWNKESGWNTQASNPSGAYGIPQALPGSKMATAGPDWQSSARTQIKWGLGYIRDRYGTPCGAWQHSESTGWY
jgi:hypothetical protein